MTGGVGERYRGWEKVFRGNGKEGREVERPFPAGLGRTSLAGARLGPIFDSLWTRQEGVSREAARGLEPGFSAAPGRATGRRGGPGSSG